jgi:hypothetical protein
MNFVGIAASGLESGSYYNGGGESDINALKTNKSKSHAFTPQREHHRLGLKTTVGLL